MIVRVVILCLISNTLFGQTTPPEKFFDWTGLQFSKEEYASRRAKMIELLKASGESIYITPSRDGVSHGETFRQSNDFQYFTGLELPNSILCLDAQNDQVILFTPDRDLRFESASRQNDFPGRPLGTDPELSRRSGISDIRPMKEFSSALGGWASGGRTIAMNGGRQEITALSTDFIYHWDDNQRLIHHIQQKYPNAKITNAFSDLARLRMVHSPAEIAVLRKAAQITMDGLKAAVAIIQPGVDERNLEAEMEAEFKRQGAQRLAFASIIKSGPNSLWPWRILASHYDRRNRKMEAGELVIFDVGCEYNYYSSDMGRTFPVSGKFSDEQREILEMEVAVADAIIAAIKPGVTFADLRKVAFEAIPDDQEQFMQAGLYHGHHIGLDTGDPSLLDAPLEPGMIFTVEPWYYNHQTGISVFTEDEVLVTESGVEVLTRDLPRTPDELEKMVGRK